MKIEGTDRKEGRKKKWPQKTQKVTKKFTREHPSSRHSPGCERNRGVVRSFPSSFLLFVSFCVFCGYSFVALAGLWQVGRHGCCSFTSPTNETARPSSSTGRKGHGNHPRRYGPWHLRRSGSCATGDKGV